MQTKSDTLIWALIRVKLGRVAEVKLIKERTKAYRLKKNMEIMYKNNKDNIIEFGSVNVE